MPTPSPLPFARFAALHVPGDPVVLFNVWDAGSAKAVGAAGAKALATGSHPVASAHGFPDGETVPIEFALANAKRIVDAVELPVSVDFEGAYSTDPARGAENVAILAATGVVGCNFEDQVIGGEGVHPLQLQGQRIAAIRCPCSASGWTPSPPITWSSKLQPTTPVAARMATFSAPRAGSVE